MAFYMSFLGKFLGILTLIFKDEESHKMSAEDTHALKLGGGELINSPVLDSLCSLNIDAEYVFVFLNIIIILNIMQ